MRNLSPLFTLCLLLAAPQHAFASNTANFDFNIKIIAQMCKISIVGTSLNEVDFGNVTVADIRGNKVQPIQTKIILTDCTTSNFIDAHVKISPKNYLDGITFIDDPNKGFGISFSDKSNIMNSTSTTDFYERESNVWSNISENQLDKTLYTYVRCKQGNECAPQVGDFQSTITFSFVVD